MSKQMVMMALLAPLQDLDELCRGADGKKTGKTLHMVGDRVLVPEEFAGRLEDSRRAVRVHTPGKPAATGDILTTLNEGEAKALEDIKGIGNKTAADIIASREADGPFESLEDAAERVGGVSLKQLQA